MHIKIVNNWRVSLKRPYYALVAGKPLCSDKGIAKRQASARFSSVFVLGSLARMPCLVEPQLPTHPPNQS